MATVQSNIIENYTDCSQGKKEIAACAESRFFPLFATNFMYSLMYSLLKIAIFGQNNRDFLLSLIVVQ